MKEQDALRRSLEALLARGLIYPTPEGWALTENGRAVARKLREEVAE